MCKTCTKCSRELPLESFNRNKRRKKDGRENKCRECTNTEKQEPTRREVNLKTQKNWRENNKDYQVNWRKDNLEHVEYRKKYYEEHKDEYIKRKQLWRKNNPSREAETRKNYIEKNKDEMNKYAREWKANKRIIDVNYKIKENMSRRIRYELTSGKTKSTCDYIGCSIDYLKMYLESKFSSWMNWENYGKIWQIDHIIPCKSWDFSKEFDNYCCWNYRNLQPLYITTNIIKKDKFEEMDKLCYEVKMKTILF
jgi:hypothetical protein